MPDSTGDNMSAELRSHPTDADLVRASREGEPRAFEQLVERHFPMVYAIAYARLGQAEAAEDLAQEVFLRAHLFLHSLAFPDRFAGWLSRIARNEAITWLRARQRSSRLVRMVPLEDFMEEHIESQEKGARERMSAREEARAVHEALFRLSAEDREIVMLHFFEGLSQTEIAASLEMHHTTVSRRLRKALKEMKRSIEPMLREAGPAFRAPRRGAARTALLVGAVSLLSAQSKAALVTAAGGAAWAQSVALLATRDALGTALTGSGIGSTPTAGGTFLGKILLGGAIMNTKALVVSLLVVLGGAAFVFLGMFRDENGNKGTKRERLASASAGLSGKEGTGGGDRKEGVASGAGTGSEGRTKGSEESGTPAASQGNQPGLTTHTLSARVVWKGTGEGATSASLSVSPAGLIPNARGGQPRLAIVASRNGNAGVAYPSSWTKGRLTVGHPGAVTARRELELPPRGLVLVELERGATIHGTVVDADTKKRVSGARVWAIASDQETVSGADGSYELSRLAPGQARVAAERPPLRSYGRTPDIPSLGLKAGERLRHDLAVSLHPILSGVVRNGETKAPIPGARIGSTVSDTEVRTDETGMYRMEGLKPRTSPLSTDGYSLEASIEGYVTQWVNVPFAGTEDVTCNFDLEPGAEVEIRVVDGQGKPVEGAVIGMVVDFALRSTGLKTDAEGRLRLGGLSFANPQQVYSEKEGYLRTELCSLRFRHDRTAEPLTLVLKRQEEKQLVFFAGRITDIGGNPLEDMSVVCDFSDKTNTGQSRRSLSDKNGFYVLGLENPGRVDSLTAGGKGWAAQKKERLVPGINGGFTEVNFVLEPGHWIAGVVVDRAGNPVSGQPIQVDGLDSLGHQILLPGESGGATTDELGRFRAEGVPAGKVFLWIMRRGMSNCNAAYEVDREHRIVLKPEGTISGRVVYAESGKPVPEFTVDVANQRQAAGNMATTPRKFSSADGRFVVGKIVSDEEYQIKIITPDRPVAVFKDIVASPLDEGKVVPFEITKGTPLRGVVVDGTTGLPVANALVVYAFRVSKDRFNWSDLDRSRTTALRDAQRAVTGLDATFQFNEGDEKGTVFVRASGYLNLMIKPAERPAALPEQPMRIALRKGGSISGTYSRGGVPQANTRTLLTSKELPDQFFGWSMTDGEGRFRWDGLAAAEYRVTAMREDQVQVGKTVRLGEAEHKVIEFGSDLGLFSLSGTIRDAAGTPLTGAVIATPKFEWDYCYFFSPSSFQNIAREKGNYRFEGLRPGLYELEIHAVPGDGQSMALKKTVSLEKDLVQDIAFGISHGVLVGLAFPEGITDRGRGRFAQFTLEAAGPDGLAAGKDSVLNSATATPQGNRLVFNGRFQGQYRLTFRVQDGQSWPKVELPDVYSLDNLEKDQDLGEIQIRIPASLQLQEPF